MMDKSILVVIYLSFAILGVYYLVTIRSAIAALFFFLCVLSSIVFGFLYIRSSYVGSIILYVFLASIVIFFFIVLTLDPKYLENEHEKNNTLNAWHRIKSTISFIIIVIICFYTHYRPIKNIDFPKTIDEILADKNATFLTLMTERPSANAMGRQIFEYYVYSLNTLGVILVIALISCQYVLNSSKRVEKIKEKNLKKMAKNFINNKKFVFQSLIATLVFFTNCKLSNALIQLEDIEKEKSKVNLQDFKNYYDFIENFDKKDYVNFIINISFKFQMKLNSGYTYVWAKKNFNESEEFDYFHFRMCGNIISKLTRHHGMYKDYLYNHVATHSNVSPFLVEEFNQDSLNQKMAYFPFYVTKVYTKSKLQFNTTGFSNNFFQKFYGTNKKKSMINFYDSYKKDLIGSFCDWWASADDNYYTDYKIFILFFFSSFFVSFAIFVISNIAGNSTSIFFERAKTSIYECGFQPFERIDKCQIFVFYRLSVFFIIFEAELMFLYPWAINVCEMSVYSISFFYNASFFIFILFYGFIFEIKNKALDI